MTKSDNQKERKNYTLLYGLSLSCINWFTRFNTNTRKPKSDYIAESSSFLFLHKLVILLFTLFTLPIKSTLDSNQMHVIVLANIPYYYFYTLANIFPLHVNSVNIHLTFRKFDQLLQFACNCSGLSRTFLVLALKVLNP